MATNFTQEYNEIEGRKDRLKFELEEEKKVLSRLRDNRVQTSHTMYGDTADIDRQIEYAKNRIEALEREIADLQKNGIDYANKAAEKSRKEENAAKEKRKAEKEEKIMLFKQVKRAYTKAKGHGWDRFLDTINGKRPKWSEIKKYNIAELRYLDDVSRGDTHFINDQIRKTEARMEKKGASYKEINKEKSRKKWDYFVTELQSRQNVNLGIRVEGEGLYRR